MKDSTELSPYQKRLLQDILNEPERVRRMGIKRAEEIARNERLKRFKKQNP